MPEYIVGLKYSFTVDMTVLEKDFALWGVSGDVKVELCYGWEHPPTSIYVVLDSKTIHSYLSKTDEIYTARVEPKTVTYSGTFKDVGDLHLFLKWGPEAWQEYSIGTVKVRPARLIVKITDDKGNPLSDVTIEAYPTWGWEKWWGPLTGKTGADGVAIIELKFGAYNPLYFIDKPLDVYAYKIGYDNYPSRTHIGTAPAPKDAGGDTSISGVMKYTGAGIAPAPVTVTVIVRDAETRKPLMGANVQLDTRIASTDVEGKVVFSNVPSGTYHLTVSRDGYESFSSAVDIVLSCTIEVNLHSLAPPPKPPVYITVTVRVYDAYTKSPLKGATVTLDSASKTTDASGLAVFEHVQGRRTAHIKVTCPDYKDYEVDVSLPEGNVEIGVGLIPKAVAVPPKITLSVDKTSIAEGETVTFTVEPSDIDVDLYEIIGTEYKYMLTFRGQTSLKPEAGDHTYAVKYIYKYGTYTAEIWSNIVYVHVEVGKPFAVENWIVKVNVQVNGKPVGEGEAEVELNETTEWQTAKHHYGPIPTDSNGWAVFSNVAGAYYLGGKKYSDIKYDVIARLKVEKMGIPAGSILKASLILEDGSYKTG